MLKCWIALGIFGGQRDEHGKPPRGRPRFANDQAAKILELLRQAEAEGVSKEFLSFGCGYTQAAARIFELERRGYKIRHEMRPGDRYTTYVLVSSAETGEPLPTYERKQFDGNQGKLSDVSADWFVQQTGRPTPETSTARLGAALR